MSLAGMTAAVQQVTGLRCAVCLVRNPDTARPGVTIAAGTLACAEHIEAAVQAGERVERVLGR